jgi:exopolysaccharide biosynthesis polyprenyl glycosylphosphotransferase
MTAADFLLFLLWSAFANNIYARIFPPHKMLIIHGGGGQSLQLIDKMAARSEKYLIQEAIGTDVGKTILSGKIAEYAAVVLCDLSAEDRNYYIKLCFEKDVRVYTTPKISDILLRSAENITLFDTPLLLNRNYGLSLEQKFLKRTIDIVLAVIMLTVAMPFMLFTAIAVKLQDGGPVLYRQERLTLHGKSFTLYKFRSMVVDAEKQHGMQLSTQNDSRITKVGEFIRRTRLDELPQLWNVIIGDMSLVGPRPERPEFVKEHIRTMPEFSYRLKIRAGLTGYAQVVGKYNTTTYDKLKMDLEYLTSYSLLLDFKILFLTLKVLFQRESTEGVKDNGATQQKESCGTE